MGSPATPPTMAAIAELCALCSRCATAGNDLGAGLYAPLEWPELHTALANLEAAAVPLVRHLDSMSVPLSPNAPRADAGDVQSAAAAQWERQLARLRALLAAAPVLSGASDQAVAGGSAGGKDGATAAPSSDQAGAGGACP